MEFKHAEIKTNNEPLTMEQFEFDLGLEPAPSKEEPNPMAKHLGYGPQDVTCKTCKHLYCKVVPSGNRFYKCTRQQLKSGSLGQDWRQKWKSCRLYEEKENTE